MLLNAIALAAAMVAAVIGGLVASSWIWAIACAVFVYAGFSVGAMIWFALKIRSGGGIWRVLGRLDDEDDFIDSF